MGIESRGKRSGESRKEIRKRCERARVNGRQRGWWVCPNHHSDLGYSLSLSLSRNRIARWSL
jgi:hypothetical protein